jgi:uncharacterized protein YcbX
MHVSALNIHPVKSLRGISVTSAEVDDLGAVGDRRFLIIDAKGDFITQRSVPRMATIGAHLGETTLTLSAGGAHDLVVRRAPDSGAKLMRVRVWKSEGLMAEDCGIESAAWLSSTLGVDCRLVRLGPAFRRPVLKPLAIPGEVVHFADAGPFLAVNESSLDDLNQRIREGGGSAVPLDRFRTNLVVRGFVPFAEDSWKRIRIGEVVFRSLGPSARCVITTTDQATGERGVEPLRTLATFRRDPTEHTNVNFGQNLVNESKSGVIRVGDPVHVLD